ncbi:MAG: PLP-dependent aminotransferase family protein [Jiangellaceae bacterium]
MDLHVSLVGTTGLSAQIYRQIRAAVLERRLLPGQALPSTRGLAARLEVSRNTVSMAYDHLTAEGFLTGRAGAGTYVSEYARRSLPRRPSAPVAPLSPRPAWEALPEPLDMTAAEPRFDFRLGMPDARLFPFATWRRLVADQLRASAVGLGAYADAAGHPGLRAAIARHLAVSRSVDAVAGDVLVTCGTQQALDVVARVLVDPGDVVAVEDPGYPPAHRVFQSSGARLLGVPVDAEGMRVDALPEQARLVYVTPSHQLPLGMQMSLPRRLALLDWAERTGTVIVEDDYDSEFRYTGRPIEPLQSMDRAGLVVYVGSFSKTMLPTLRLGFCVAPPSLVPALRKAKYVLDWHTAVPMQAALAEFIDAGLLARHIRRMRNVYRVRRDRIAVAMERDFADDLTPISSVAGLHVTAWLHRGTADDALEVVRRAHDAGVEIKALSDFAVSSMTPPGLVLGYGVIPTDRIDEGLRRLRACVDLTA